MAEILLDNLGNQLITEPGDSPPNEPLDDSGGGGVITPPPPTVADAFPLLLGMRLRLHG